MTGVPVPAGRRPGRGVPGVAVRAAVVLSAVVLVAGCVSSPPPQPEPVQWGPPAAVDASEVLARQVRRVAREGTVRLRVEGCAGLRIGSGFLLDGGVVVTNRHVASPSRSVSLTTWDGRELPVTLLGVADDVDVAVLRLDGASAASLAGVVLRPRAEPVNLGETVIAVGYPEGGALTLASGSVVSTGVREVLGRLQDVVVSSTAATEGSSGGPLLTGSGELVGVLFAAAVTGDQAVSVPVARVTELIRTGAVRAQEGC